MQSEVCNVQRVWGLTQDYVTRGSDRLDRLWAEAISWTDLGSVEVYKAVLRVVQTWVPMLQEQGRFLVSSMVVFGR